MPIAVNTAIAFPSAQPSATKLGIKPNAAPTAPNAVIGKANKCGSRKPNSHSKMKLTLSAQVRQQFYALVCLTVVCPV